MTQLSEKTISTLKTCSVMVDSAANMLDELPDDVNLSQMIDQLSAISDRLDDCIIYHTRKSRNA